MSNVNEKFFDENFDAGVFAIYKQYYIDALKDAFCREANRIDTVIENRNIDTIYDSKIGLVYALLSAFIAGYNYASQPVIGKPNL